MQNIGIHTFSIVRKTLHLVHRDTHTDLAGKDWLVSTLCGGWSLLLCHRDQYTLTFHEGSATHWDATFQNALSYSQNQSQ